MLCVIPEFDYPQSHRSWERCFFMQQKIAQKGDFLKTYLTASFKAFAALNFGTFIAGT
jgi:hypothetical protein